MDTRILRSCTLCRQRKVKYDRQQPCSNCTRAETQCVFPQGLGRAPKRPRKAVEAWLLAQSSRLESLVKPSQCLDLLGLPRSSALETYRFAVEKATARADLLNTQNLILLQATVLFLTALRNEGDPRTVWSLTSLVYHIAQAMGLHRDGQNFGLRPLETELRRRIWWHIYLLDYRSTDYHDTELIVHEAVFDTHMPLTSTILSAARSPFCWQSYVVDLQARNATTLGNALRLYMSGGMAWRRKKGDRCGGQFGGLWQGQDM
ncbi:hypothetical protein BDW60DRAFT_209692 [Aspergillus nidulans var. acristatus]